VFKMKDSDKLWGLCCAVFRENERTEPGISYSSTVSGSASTKCTESGGICSTGGWDAGCGYVKTMYVECISGTCNVGIEGSVLAAREQEAIQDPRYRKKKIFIGLVVFVVAGYPSWGF
ncbi:MAG: hypothetical protein ACK559_27185, partial [bacterium]